MRTIEDIVIDNLKRYLKDNSYKNNVLSKATGLKDYTITAILNKKRRLYISEYIDIVNFLNLNYDYFLKDKKEGVVNPTTNCNTFNRKI